MNQHYRCQQCSQTNSVCRHLNEFTALYHQTLPLNCLSLELMALTGAYSTAALSV